jgi:membrane-bound lytic murein transglycosylase A
VTPSRFTRLLPFIAFVFLAGCAVRPPPAPRLTLTQVGFADLDGWKDDHPGEALPALIKSCAEIAKRADKDAVGPPSLKSTAADWRGACNTALQTASDDDSARAYFERYFTPYLAANNDEREGLFTGYYEPLLNGARQRGGPYQTPILKRPPDLVMVELARFRPAWRGERIAGRVVNGALLPYDNRAAIERGALDRMNLAIFWVDDPVAAFFAEIQGSARIALSDGSTARLGYDAQNGQTYVPIGRLLVERGALTREEVSMQGIRAWIKAHPQDGAALMDENPSYVFFRELSGDGPLGSEGVVLTPGRSLAVDRNFIPLGAPIFLVATNGEAPLRRLVIAQDTGGAIGGPVRGDVFWGFGEDAEAIAGRMRARGRYYLLLPKTIAPVLSMTLP